MHRDYFDCWRSEIQEKIHVCRFDIHAIQWSWPIQKFLKVLHSSVPQYLNLSRWFALFVLDQGSLIYYTSLPVSSLRHIVVSYLLRLQLLSMSLLAHSTNFYISALMLFLA